MWSYVQYRRIGAEVEAQINTDIEKRHTPSPPPVRPDSNGEKHVIFHVEPSGDDDPLDPKNWPLMVRCKNIAILMLLIFVQAWAGASGALSNKQASEAFGVSPTVEDLALAMYLFGVGSGSLFFGPLSETVGRNPTYLVSTFGYLFFVLGCALTPTFGGLLVCRYFVGLFCSATLSINGASVRDQFRPVKLAFFFPLIAWANLAGKAPIIPSI